MADVTDLTDPSGRPLKPKSSEPKEENVDYKDKYLRALADYKNLQRQVHEERKVVFEVATARVLEQFLPVLDHIYQAEVFMNDQGLKLVRDQFENALKELGLSELEVLGKEYDPHTAEVVDTVEGDENMVVAVVRRGYKIGDRIVRVAQVKVGKKG
jgi:molecular chaperone GrpE